MTRAVRSPDRYDGIGRTYQQTRREDPRLAGRIHAALGDARTVVNVGAGTGSYEPPGRAVLAVEPSAVMIAQRSARAAPVVQALAENIPLRDRCFEAAMALWTIHHWTDLARGLAELRRVAGRVVIVAPSILLDRLWLTTDYFPAMTRGRRPEIQPEQIARALGENVRIEPLPVPRDCVDGFGEAYWARPEAYLDPVVRAGMSAFALLTPEETEPGLRRLAADLESGGWDERHGHLRDLEELDCGHRLIVAEL
ncbi:MAG TPA: class I SAM-dependent methyltransferase [Streptosporangiaceae bacterium]|nr:class I SAM-dependent methyltransferase [Streptosporangiaceae bacterium]